jgi:hypothetical protein
MTKIFCDFWAQKSKLFVQGTKVPLHDQEPSVLDMNL